MTRPNLHDDEGHDLAVHVIIPTHNRPSLLERTLDAIAAGTIPQEVVTVHVVENGSQVSEEVTRRHGLNARLPLQYSHYHDGNKSAALNATLKSIEAEALLIFIDDDVRVSPDTLPVLVDGVKTHGANAYYGIALRADYEAAPDPELIPYLPHSAKNYSLSKDGTDKVFTKEFHLFLGACWAVYRRKLVEAGGFDAKYGPGATSGTRGQEGDAQLRMFRNGVRPVFLGQSFVWHFVPLKVLTREWVLDRIFNSAKYIGENKAKRSKTVVNLYSLALAIGRRYLGMASFRDLVHCQRAAGYFWGLSHYWRKGDKQ